MLLGTSHELICLVLLIFSRRPQKAKFFATIPRVVKARGSDLWRVTWGRGIGRASGGRPLTLIRRLLQRSQLSSRLQALSGRFLDLVQTFHLAASCVSKPVALLVPLSSEISTEGVPSPKMPCLARGNMEFQLTHRVRYIEMQSSIFLESPHPHLQGHDTKSVSQHGCSLLRLIASPHGVAPNAVVSPVVAACMINPIFLATSTECPAHRCPFWLFC